MVNKRQLLSTPNMDRIARGDAVRSVPRHELDLRAEPGDSPHRQVLAHQRLLQQQQLPVRQHAADVPQAPAGGRLHDGADRQMAPGERSDGLRLLAHPARARDLLQPADDRERGADQTRGLRDRHHHGPVDRVAEESRQVEAVPADEPAQGAASRVVAGAAASGLGSGSPVPGAGDAVR